jgi:hypothetical protein
MSKYGAASAVPAHPSAVSAEWCDEPSAKAYTGSPARRLP